MSLEVKTGLATFSTDKLKRYRNSAGKADRFDACTYTLQSLPIGVYSTGWIKVKITQLSNVVVFMNGGHDREHADKVVVT